MTEWVESAHAAHTVGGVRCHSGDATSDDVRDAHRFVLPAGRRVAEFELEPAYPYRPRSISASTEQLTGYTPREYRENPTRFAVRLHPDDLARVLAMYVLAMDIGGFPSAPRPIRRRPSFAAGISQTLVKQVNEVV